MKFRQWQKIANKDFQQKYKTFYAILEKQIIYLSRNLVGHVKRRERIKLSKIELSEIHSSRDKSYRGIRSD